MHRIRRPWMGRDRREGTHEDLWITLWAPRLVGGNEEEACRERMWRGWYTV
jgi:hypothetical protein